MSHSYRGVGWSRQKRRYDLVVVTSAFAYLAAFAVVTVATQPYVTAETVILRATGSLAFVMLTAVLLIGPLARISARWLPVLYNRRHLGVATFLAALAHGAFATFQFHGLGDLNPVVSLLVSDGEFGDGRGIPFQPLGAVVLAVLFVMAATSHDFWLATLTPRVWKGIHMAVYPAYALLLGHVALGALQGEGKDYLWPVLAGAAATVFSLHLHTGLKQRRLDRTPPSRRPSPDAPQGYVRTIVAAEIPDAEGRVVSLGDEDVAVFRNGSVISCLSNVCSHQMGPLGEGRIVDGCVTCPWHGFQYDPVTGCAPAPFTDRVATYDVVVRDGIVWVSPVANPLGAIARIAQLDGDDAHPVWEGADP